MLISLTLKGHWAGRLHRRTPVFKFKRGVNLLIGPNGSGKSTILECIRKEMLKEKNEWGEDSKIKPVCLWTVKGVPLKVLNFDFEKDNPRTNKGGIMDISDIKRMFWHSAAQAKSHGEITRKILGGMDANLDDAKTGYFVMLDEPEQALDLDGLRLLHKILISKRKRWHQFIISTHHPFLIADPRFNVIELRKGYRQEVIDTLDSVANRYEMYMRLEAIHGKRDLK